MKKKSKAFNALITPPIILGAALLGSSNFAFAEALPEYNLDQMVVTASRFGQTEFKANSNVTVVTKEKIQKQHYQNMEEVLRAVPGVNPLNYGQAGFIHSNSIRINGSTNVVVLVDGVRYSNSYDGFPPTTLNNLDEVERVEVLKGSATTLYGADAKGGVINIITRRPEKNETKLNFSAGNFGTVRYGTSTEGKKDALTYRAGYQKNKTGDYKDGHGNKVESDGKTDVYFARVGYDLDKDGTSNVSMNYNKSHYKYAYFNDFYGDGHVNGKNDVEDYGVQWKQKLGQNSTNQLSVKQIKTDYTYYTEAGSTWLMNIKTLALSDQYTLNSKSNTLIAGFDYNKDSVDYFNDSGYGATILDDGVTQKGFYLQDTYNFSDKADLTLGARYVNHSIAGNKWVPKAELGFDFNEDTHAYVSYNKFFVAPSYYNYFGPYGGKYLEPEIGDTVQLGINHKLSDKADIALNIYRTKSDNRIVYDYISSKYKNVGESKINGWSVKVNDRFTNTLSGYISYTRLNVEDTTNGITTKMENGALPKATINLGLNYSKNKLDLDLVGRGVLDRGEGAASYKFPTNTYWTFNLGSNYKPTKNIKLMAQFNNIFNQFYAEQSAANATNPERWYTMPGRSYFLGMEYSF